MTDNEFWIAVWKLVAVVFVVLITTIGGCTTYQTIKIKEMVGNGSDPIQARCAIMGFGEGANPVICYQSAIK